MPTGSEMDIAALRKRAHDDLVLAQRLILGAASLDDAEVAARIRGLCNPVQIQCLAALGGGTGKAGREAVNAARSDERFGQAHDALVEADGLLVDAATAQWIERLESESATATQGGGQ